MKIRFISLTLLLSISFTCQPQTITDTIFPIQNRIQLPYNRIIQPAGLQIFFGDEGLENHSLDVALSPDGKWLAVEERYSIIIISTSDNKVRFKLANNDHPDLRGGMNTYSGIIWHVENGIREIYWSTIGRNNRSFVVSARWDGLKAEIGRMLEYRAIPPAKMALPNEILIKKEASGEFIYVVLNGNNKIIKQDLQSGDTIWMADSGIAPYGSNHSIRQTLCVQLGW